MSAIKASTKNIYNKRLITIAKKCGYDSVPEGEVADWLASHFEELINGVSLQNGKAFCNCILHFSKNEEFREVVLKKRKEISKTLFQNYEELGIYHKTDKEKERWKEVEDLREMYNMILEKYNRKATQSRLIVLFYLYPFVDDNFAVIRNELCTIRVGQYKKDQNNWYDGKNIYLNEHKSNQSKRFRGKANVLRVPDELRGILERWIESRNIKEGDVLIQAKSLGITRILTKHVGVGTTMLRKIYESNKHLEHYKAMDEVMETATMMGHSVSVARKHYVKE